MSLWTGELQRQVADEGDLDDALAVDLGPLPAMAGLVRASSLHQETAYIGHCEVKMRVAVCNGCDVCKLKAVQSVADNDY
jgi:hypothetical protein